MNDTAAWQKYLKVLSVVLTVFYLLLALLGALMATGIVDPDVTLGVLGTTANELDGYDPALLAKIAGGIMAVGYAISALLSFLVFRGAKNSAKMKPAMVLYGILAVLGTLGVASRIVAGDFNTSLIAQVIVSWLIFFGSHRVYRSAK